MNLPGLKDGVLRVADMGTLCGSRLRYSIRSLVSTAIPVRQAIRSDALADVEGKAPPRSQMCREPMPPVAARVSVQFLAGA